MADVGEAVLGRHLVRPALDRGAVDLDCLAACPAHQVVVMGVAAGSVDALTILTDDDVDVTGLSERGECSIDRGQADGVAPVAEVIVDLLRRAKIIEVLQRFDDRGALPGRADSHTGV